MASDYDVRVSASVLDRLIDLDPSSSRDVLPSRSESVEDLKRAVRRDLESLLNARNLNTDLDTSFDQVWRSVLTYGLPDFTVGYDTKRIEQAIRAAIGAFEPRLTNVSVTLSGGSSAPGLARVRIDARLKIDPAPEPVAFDDIEIPGPRPKSNGSEAS